MGPIIITAIVERTSTTTISARGGMITKPAWVAHLSDGRRKVCPTRRALDAWLAEMSIEVQS